MSIKRADQNEGNQGNSGSVNSEQKIREWENRALEIRKVKNHAAVDQDVDLDDHTKDYIKKSLSKNTIRAYRSDFKIFSHWCEQRGFCAMPATPNVIANFLSAQAQSKTPEIKAVTIARRLSAIHFYHQGFGIELLPTKSKAVTATMRGIKNDKLVRPDQKHPTTHDIIHQMVNRCDLGSLAGIRDKAIMLLGFYGAFRRSELVSLRVEDIIKIHDKGMDLFISKSKTDQSGEGFTKPIIRGKDYCPILALEAWLEASGVSSGFIFRGLTKSGTLRKSKMETGKTDLHAETVAVIIKKYAAAINLDPQSYAGHSLRRGFCTAAIQSGATMAKVMSVTGQKDPKTVMRYFEDLNRYDDHAAEGIIG